MLPNNLLGMCRDENQNTIVSLLQAEFIPGYGTIRDAARGIIR